MTYLGLLRQRGPFKETKRDLAHVYEKDVNWQGGGVPVGGSLHAGHGYWSSSMDLPSFAPNLYILPPGEPIVSRVDPFIQVDTGGNQLRLEQLRRKENGIIVGGSTYNSNDRVTVNNIFYGGNETNETNLETARHENQVREERPMTNEIKKLNASTIPLATAEEEVAREAGSVPDRIQELNNLPSMKYIHLAKQARLMDELKTI